jgi:hypothetical protein
MSSINILSIKIMYLYMEKIRLETFETRVQKWKME